MPERRVLILSPHHLAVFNARQGQVHQESEFALDEVGQTAFKEWAVQNNSALVHLLVDLPDEGFQQETLPHVTGEDRKALLSRKLNQLFFGTPYSLVLPLGREKQGRRDEKFLFAALTRPQALEPWLHAMNESGTAVAGIHTPALLLPRLLDRKAMEAPRLIVITLGSGGLRQSYFEHGQLCFSRLKPLSTGGIEEAAVNAYGEAVRIYQYLIGQRLITRGEKIPVVCLASPRHTELLRRACADTDELSFAFDNLSAIGKARGLKEPIDDSNTDALLAYMLTQQAPSLQFGNTVARLGYLRWRWRNAIRIATASCLALMGAFIIATFYSVLSANAQRDQAQLSAQVAQQRYAAIVNGLPAIPITPEQLRNLTAQWQQLQARSPALATSLQPLSTALQQNPKIELKALSWRLTSSPDSTDTKAGDDSWLVIDIEAALPAANGLTRRDQNKSIEQFTEALKQSAADNARILQRPFDTDPGKSLKGDNEIYAGKGALPFTVRYWRRNAE